MNIGQAAEHTGLSAKTIRYYEDIDLVTPARRRDNGYRDYVERDIHMLRFVARARDLGFSVEDCRVLLALYDDKGRKSADVKEIALRRVADIDEKIEALKGMRATLAHLAEKCHGDDRPDCPILDEFAEGGSERI
ncbi:MAG: Cu(I)-responsive transcriptional regulator [Alphaproteobacteria bacterium]|nr:Cu(I)-responsive transcriptional regulator [Alphaproteobacteria bacterium]